MCHCNYATAKMFAFAIHQKTGNTHASHSFNELPGLSTQQNCCCHDFLSPRLSLDFPAIIVDNETEMHAVEGHTLEILVCLAAAWLVYDQRKFHEFTIIFEGKWYCFILLVESLLRNGLRPLLRICISFAAAIFLFMGERNREQEKEREPQRARLEEKEHSSEFRSILQQQKNEKPFP